MTPGWDLVTYHTTDTEYKADIKLFGIHRLTHLLTNDPIKSRMTPHLNPYSSERGYKTLLNLIGFLYKRDAMPIINHGTTFPIANCSSFETSFLKCGRTETKSVRARLYCGLNKISLVVCGIPVNVTVTVLFISRLPYVPIEVKTQ